MGQKATKEKILADESGIVKAMVEAKKREMEKEEELNR